MIKLLYLSILFLIVSCQEQLPQLSELGQANINSSSSFRFNQNTYLINTPEEALTISGVCDARFTKLEASVDGGTTWRDFTTLFSGGSHDGNCSDQNFSIVMTRIADYVDFTSNTSGDVGRYIKLRGDLGYTKTSVISAYIRSGDFTPPAAPTIKVLSQFDTPKIYITSGGTETDFSRFECKVNSGTWYACSNNTTITDNGTAIARGFEGTLHVSAIDTTGNRSDIVSAKFKNGILGRGIYGTVNDILELDNGDILVGGSFTTYEPLVTNYLARFDENGEFDHSFNPGAGANNQITNMINAANDQMYIYGPSISTYQGFTYSKTVKINEDSSRDAFTTTTPHIPLLELSNGDVLYNVITNTTNRTISRRDSSGTEIWSIQYYDAVSGRNTLRKVMADNSNLYILSYKEYQESTTMCLKRYQLSNGAYLNDVHCTQNTNYSAKKGAITQTKPFYQTVSALNDFEIDNDGNIIIVGDLNIYNAVEFPSCMQRIDPNGIILNSFGTITIDNYISNSSTVTYATCLKNIYKTASGFIVRNGYSVNDKYIALNFFGDRVHTFPTTWANSEVSNLKQINSNNSMIQDGTSLYFFDEQFSITKSLTNIGTFNSISNTENYYFIATAGPMMPDWTKNTSNLLLFDSKGNVKKTFTGINGAIRKILKQGSKYILIGDFTNYGSYKHIARLNSDLTLDTTTPSVFATSGTINSALLDKNNNIYLSGTFPSITVNGTPFMKAKLAKLNSDFEVDTPFTPPSILYYNGTSDVSATIYNIALDDTSSNQSDWRIYLSGDFTRLNSYTTYRIGSISAINGAIDTNFLGRYREGTPTTQSFMDFGLYFYNDKIYISNHNGGTYHNSSNVSIAGNSYYILNKLTGELITTPSAGSATRCFDMQFTSNYLFVTCMSGGIVYYNIANNSYLGTKTSQAFNKIIELSNGNLIWGGAFNGSFGPVATKRRSGLALTDANGDLLDDMFADWR